MKKIRWKDTIEDNIIESEDSVSIINAVPYLQLSKLTDNYVAFIQWVCTTNKDELINLCVYFSIEDDYDKDFINTIPFYSNGNFMTYSFLNDTLLFKNKVYVLVDHEYEIDSKNINLDMDPKISFKVYYSTEQKILTFKMNPALFGAFNYINNYIENGDINIKDLYFALLDAYKPNDKDDKITRIFNVEKVEEIKDIRCIDKKKKSLSVVCTVSQQINNMTLYNNLSIPMQFPTKLRKLKYKNNDYIDEYINIINNFLYLYYFEANIINYGGNNIFIKSFNKVDTPKIFMFSEEIYSNLLDMIEEKIKEYK